MKWGHKTSNRLCVPYFQHRYVYVANEMSVALAAFVLMTAVLSSACSGNISPIWMTSHALEVSSPPVMYNGPA